jgi:hypothetical protein
MNYRNTTLVVAAIVAAAALTGVAFAIPQHIQISDLISSLRFSLSST